jgi:hypothetical protein
MSKNGRKNRITVNGGNIVIIDDLMCLNPAGIQDLEDKVGFGCSSLEYSHR